MSGLGFYSHQASIQTKYFEVGFMCVNTRTRLTCRQYNLENQAYIQNRLVFDTGFNTRHYGSPYIEDMNG